VGDREHYEPGTFSWVDLATTDQAAAKDFYARLLGWEYDDRPAGEGVVYSMARVRGRNAAAISPQPERMRAAGAPPSWMSYVTVQDADATASRARELGATLYAEPFDVFDAGRMAVIADPEGAVFAVWQPGEMIGAGVVNEAGALSWNDLATRDPEGAQRFYSELFGWTFEQAATIYMTIRNGSQMNGGLRLMGEGEEQVPPHWMPYFAVADLDASIALAGEHGGRAHAPPMEVPAGRFAALADPQGASFALFAGDFDP
jgi:predicted enzyme related to lactoylglutathione lyase